jgi:hypothetical protein
VADVTCGVHLSADCWACGRLTGRGHEHAEWCTVDDDGRYRTDVHERWPAAFRRRAGEVMPDLEPVRV